MVQVTGNSETQSMYGSMLLNERYNPAVNIFISVPTAPPDVPHKIHINVYVMNNISEF